MKIKHMTAVRETRHLQGVMTAQIALLQRAINPPAERSYMTNADRLVFQIKLARKKHQRLEAIHALQERLDELQRRLLTRQA